MKIICIGRNYADHAKELNNELPEEPVIFLKPDTALLKPGQDFYLPENLGEIHHEVELVVRICRHGKNIQEKFAPKYYEQVSLGIDFTARQKQAELKKKGLPWELAKGFDGSAVIGELIPKTELKSLDACNFELKVNGDSRQKGNTEQMIFNINNIIAFVSAYFTLKVGDLIYTGTPAGVGPVKQGDKLEAFIESREGPLLLLNVK